MVSKNFEMDELIWMKCFLPDDSQGKENYFLNTELLSWRDAQSYCRLHHTDLVSVKTEVQNQEVHVQGNGLNIWIGLIREDWMWSDRNAGSFRNWEKNNPNNLGGAENCAAIRKDFQYQWDDLSCNSRYPFVCHGGELLNAELMTILFRHVGNLWGKQGRVRETCYSRKLNYYFSVNRSCSLAVAVYEIW